MRTRRLAPVLSILSAALATAGVLVAVASSPRADAARLTAAIAKIDPTDRAKLLADALLTGDASFLVILEPQADLSAASALPDKAAKGRWVHGALLAVAGQTQPELIRALRAAGAEARPLIIVNAVGVRGNLQSLVSAAEYALTARIVADTPVRADLPEPAAPPSEIVSRPSAVSAAEWGVNAVNAPAVWSMGYTGTGIIVGGQDTGVRWDHTALIGHYRGWDGSTVDHDYNWHDAIHAAPGNPCGADNPAPCDDSGHGTHTVGTIVGDDGAGNQIGVAPGAAWIACRNMDGGFGAPSTYLECFEWFLAPYPITGTIADGDPARAPHVINNSWSCPDYEGCVTGQEIISGVLAMRAAGILTVAAATNDGPSCSTITDPLAIHAEAFTVGAFEGGGNIASFSSRGPVTRDGSGRIKPDIAAPGVSVRSATKTSTTSYAWFSGTSMAAPHVVGAAALLWNAAPYLVGEVDLTEWVLRLNAAPTFTTQGCGGDTPASRPNNVWGWGKVDAWAAVSATFSLTPTAVLTHTVLSPDWVILDASASFDPETPLDALLARWDLDGDGGWDTPWSLDKVITGAQASIAPIAAVQIADSGGRTDVAVGVSVASAKSYLPIIAVNH